MNRGRNRGRQRPKRLLILRKSYNLRRWLLRNPWIRPMCVFNYAAIKIQQGVRGLLRRKVLTNGKATAAPRLKKKATNKQLDKYLAYLDQSKRNGKRNPPWADEGYSSWCAVRVQSYWRMVRTRRKFLVGRRLVNQVASIIIQTTWRNRMYRLAPKKNVILDVYVAAEMIQLCWRSFCNRRIYKYFRDLVLLKLKGAPYELLRSIIPTESHLLDRASGTHVRFRLGSQIFPPKVYFKIYTHRPLCDVNSFAPRDYKNERPSDPMQVENRSETLTMKSSRFPQIKVGVRYFDAVVRTTCAEGTANWYRREEGNDWRPIASVVFDNIVTPPWFREISYSTKPKHFHFSKLRRAEDIKKAKKKRRRQWMVKAYMQASGAAVGVMGSEEVVDDQLQGLSLTAEPKSKPSGKASSKSLKQRAAADFKDSFSDSVTSSEHKSALFPRLISAAGSGGPNNRVPAAGVLAALSATAGSPQKNDLQLYGVDSDAAKKKSNNKDPMVDLVDWSMALNFDDYTTSWDYLGTSLPSDAQNTVYK
mmetsp:Transcript_2340/g.4164  ORF Transcript_2340/g.4164 Transcript_2340/m.4164 type:complete len:532 (+) Transcript_2340:74-1669(+)